LEASFQWCFRLESKLKDNGSSTKDFEDEVINGLLSKVHRHEIKSMQTIIAVKGAIKQAGEINFL